MDNKGGGRNGAIPTHARHRSEAQSRTEQTRRRAEQTRRGPPAYGASFEVQVKSAGGASEQSFPGTDPDLPCYFIDSLT